MLFLAGEGHGNCEKVRWTRRHPPMPISTILLNVNAKSTNVILGSENHILYGPGYIEDTLCGVPVQLGPLSFYQVNTLAAEQLYGIAAQYAQLTPDDQIGRAHV